MKSRILPADWYSVSVDTARRALSLLGLALVVLAGTAGFKHWQRLQLRDRAFQTIQEAEQLERIARARDEYAEIRTAQKPAWDHLYHAQEAFGEHRFRAAKDDATRSVAIFENALGLGSPDAAQTIRVISLQGNVSYRRSDTSAWTRARSQTRLRPGDWIRTSSQASAEVIYPDGTVLNLREETVLQFAESGELGSREGSGRTATIVTGEIELNTTGQGSTVTTPSSEARIAGNSEARVAYAQDREVGQFANYDGEDLRISTKGGQGRVLKPLESVEERGGRLSETRQLPPAPMPIAPLGGAEFDRAAGRVELSWRPVTGASFYLLRVSSSHLFASNIIEKRYRKASATLGMRGEGSFYWQVAAVGPNGRGPWSDAGTFRVISLEGIAPPKDSTPPPLDILSVETRGNLVMVSGRSEPGARVEINGRSISVRSDGSFDKAVEMSKEGLEKIRIVATDRWGNQTTKEEEVFIEEYL